MNKEELQAIQAKAKEIHENSMMNMNYLPESSSDQQQQREAKEESMMASSSSSSYNSWICGTINVTNIETAITSPVSMRDG